MIDEELFYAVCVEAKSMAEASRRLGLSFGVFKSLAKQRGLYKPNIGLKGLVKDMSHKVPLHLILSNEIPCRSERLKKRLYIENLKEPKCEKCGIIDWMGYILKFHLHHKDGNGKNNVYENLEILCPNCHSQSETYCRNLETAKEKALFKAP